MTKLTNPMPLWLNARGSLLDAGMIRIGVAGADPAAQPIQVYWDIAQTIPATQPLRTLGGVIVNGATPSFVFYTETDASVRVEDADGNLVSYYPSQASGAPDYQPLDADLTAIAAQGSTPYGRGLLSLGNQAALKAATGIADALPLTGGTVTGNVLRQGAGVHEYWADAGMTSGRKFLTPNTASDPTSQPGDEWNKYVP